MLPLQALSALLFGSRIRKPWYLAKPSAPLWLSFTLTEEEIKVVEGK
jgi:hypothetical protein